MLCIRRTLAEGRASGFASGLGAATADAIYGFIAGFGLTFISNLLVSQKHWFSLVGGAFLLYLGYKTFIAEPSDKAAKVSGTGLLRAYLSTFGLTLTNPMTILSFIAIFAGLGLATAVENYGAASLFVFGVFCGSALWWLLLSTGVGLLRTRFNHTWMRWVNRISGVIILAFGLLTLWSLVSA